MAQCIGRTKKGEQCQRLAKAGSEYCALHQPQLIQQIPKSQIEDYWINISSTQPSPWEFGEIKPPEAEKLKEPEDQPPPSRPSKRPGKQNKRLGTIVAAVATVIGIVGGLLGIESYLRTERGVVLFPTPTARPPNFAIDEMLTYTDTLAENVPQMDDFVSKEDCKSDLQNYSCWIILGQTYAMSMRYRDALEMYNNAFELDPLLADSYYSVGNVYYELAMVDLIRRKKYDIDAGKLLFEISPDDYSRVLFKAALDEYAKADSKQTYNDQHPELDYLVTTRYVIEHRKDQMQRFLADPAYKMSLHQVELSRVIVWVGAVFPSDQVLIGEAAELTMNSLTQMQENPEDFPYLPVLDTPTPETALATAVPFTPGGAPDRSDWSITVADSFDGETCNWYVAEAEVGKVGCKDGWYEIEIREGNLMFFTLPNEIRSYGDFMAATTVEYQGSDSLGLFGLTFRYHDDSHAYVFAITNTGMFTVAKSTGAESQFLVEYTESSAITSGQNVLLLGVDGSEMLFEINGDTVARVVDETLDAEGQVGFVAMSFIGPSGEIPIVRFFDFYLASPPE